MQPLTWTTPLMTAVGGFIGAGLACYEITGDWLGLTSALAGHLGYVASVAGALGAVSGIASAVLDHLPRY